MKLILLRLIVFTCIVFIGCTPKYNSEKDFNTDDLKEISTLDFQSNEAMKKLLETRDTKKLRGILTTALMASRNNLLNHDTTRTEISSIPYKYQYVFVDDTLKWDLRTKESYRYRYDPVHPDAILSGEMIGYVKYPDIDKFEEDNNITKILDILLNISQQILTNIVESASLGN